MVVVYLKKGRTFIVIFSNLPNLSIGARAYAVTTSIIHLKWPKQPLQNYPNLSTLNKGERLRIMWPYSRSRQGGCSQSKNLWKLQSLTLKHVLNKSLALMSLMILIYLIAVRKGKRQCTRHPLANFVSFDNLSPIFHAFVSTLNSIEMPKIVQEPLRDENWRKATFKEMSALRKNNTCETIDLPSWKRQKKKVRLKWMFTTNYK